MRAASGRDLAIQPAILILITLAFVGPVQAGYTFRFADNTGQLTDNFTVPNVGGSVDVRVYLQETNPTTDLATIGLATYGVALNYGPSGPFAVASLADFGSSPAFNPADDFKSLVPGLASIDGINTPGPSALAGSNDAVFLATFKFTGLSPGLAAIVTVDPDPTLSFDNTLLASNTVIDGQIANRTAVINVVPEPTSAVLLIVAIGFVPTVKRFRFTKTVGGFTINRRREAH